jgi:type I restriction enzyme S subunit
MPLTPEKSAEEIPAAGDFGPAPTGWEIVRLGDYYDFQNGVNADAKAYGQGVPFANVLEVITHSHMSVGDIPGLVTLPQDAIRIFQVRRGDILFNRTSETQEEVGLTSVYLDDAETVFGGFVIRGRSKNGSFDPMYAGYAFRSPFVRSQIIVKGQGAVRANVGQADLKTVFALKPPPKEQKAIAQALSDADALIESLESLIAKKRAIKQGAMQVLLSGRKRLASFTGAWKTQELKDICIKIQDGTHFSPKLGGSDYLYVTSRNLGRGMLDLTSVETISAEEHTKIYARCDARKGDLLLTKDGANTGNAAINSIDEPISLLSSVAMLRFDPKRHNAEFYLQQILSDAGQKQIKDMMSGNAITRLTLAKIKALRFHVPQLDEQDHIAMTLSEIDEELQTLARRLAKARLIKQGMMQELLTGRIRLI